MPQPFNFEKPVGTRDILPSLYEAKTSLRQALNREINLWGYDWIETPTLEYYETIGKASAIPEHQLFKVLGGDGNTMVLKPDMTAPIARVVGTTMKDAVYPIRLAYDTSVFRSQQRPNTKMVEFEQVGIELLGDGTSSANGEVVALLISALIKAGLSAFKIAIGHVSFLNELLMDTLTHEEERHELKRFLYEKNHVGYTSKLENYSLTPTQRERLLRLLVLRGTDDILRELKDLAPTQKGLSAVHELEQLLATLELYGLKEWVTVDPTLISHMNYYTGIVFEGYAQGSGFPFCSGGRYDGLLQAFDRSAPAIGFGVNLDELVKMVNAHTSLPERLCIAFCEKRKEEAIQLAQEKRAKGQSVVLQAIDEIEHLPLYKNRFRQMITLLDKE